MKRINVYYILFLLAAGHFCVDFMIGLWPVYKTMMELDIAKAGLIAGLGAFIGEGVQIIFGPMGDRGWRKSLTVMGVMAAAASTCFIYTEEYIVLFFLYLLTCMGSGAFHPSAAAFVNGLSTGQKNLFMAVFASGGYLGLAISQIVFSSVYETVGHTVLLAIPPLLLVLIMLKIIQSQEPSNITSTHRFEGLKKFFQDRNLVLLYLACLCSQSVNWGIIFLLPDILKEMTYPSWIYLGGGHLAFILGAACLMIPGGYFADKFSPRSVLLISISVGITLVYSILFTAWPIPILFSFLFLAGASFGVVNPISITFGNSLLPGHPGAVNACLMGLVWFIAEGIGQTGGGALTLLFESDAPIKAIAILGMLALPALMAVYYLPSEAEVIEFA